MGTSAKTSAHEGLEGAWVRIAARVGASELEVADLGVRYLLLGAGTYRIIDRGNQVVDAGHFHVNQMLAPATMDMIGEHGPGAGRSVLAVFELRGDELTLAYDLEGRARPPSLAPSKDQPQLRITYTRGVLPTLSSGAPLSSRSSCGPACARP